MTYSRTFTLRRTTLPFLVHLVLLFPEQGSISQGCLALAHYALRDLPHGFPWLMDDDRQAADLAKAGKFFLFARPEHLGRVRSGDMPASVRNLHMKEPVASSSAASWTLRQGFFGVAAPKPTTFASNCQELYSLEPWSLIDQSAQCVAHLHGIVVGHRPETVPVCTDKIPSASACGGLEW